MYVYMDIDCISIMYGELTEPILFHYLSQPINTDEYRS